MATRLSTRKLREQLELPPGWKFHFNQFFLIILREDDTHSLCYITPRSDCYELSASYWTGQTYEVAAQRYYNMQSLAEGIKVLAAQWRLFS